MNAAADIARFAKLRSWFNRLTYEGDQFLLFPYMGEQPKNYFDPQVNDADGMHWWIWDARDIAEIPLEGIIKDVIMRHPVSFNCCLRGVTTAEDGSTFIEGMSIIERNNPEFELQLRNAYPFIKSLERAFELESLKQRKKAEYEACVLEAILAEQFPHVLMGKKRANLFRRGLSAGKLKKDKSVKN